MIYHSQIEIFDVIDNTWTYVDSEELTLIHCAHNGHSMLQWFQVLILFDPVCHQHTMRHNTILYKVVIHI